ncbi:MAG: endonuclease [Bacteroidales bacterium]|nr:endonuclease [Bacteroidales bacterium]
MKRAAFMFLIVWSLLSITGAQPPAGYYNSAAGLTGKALQQALHDIIDNHTVIPYDNLYTCFLTTDVKPGNIVWDMYSDKPGSTPAYVYTYGAGQECGNYNSEADCFNREHSFPKSWFDDASPMYSDLFHLYPTDGYVNNRRSNYPFGETASATWTSSNGSMVGPSSWPGYTGIVFEPIDEYKGDFARTYFYMATRYYGEDAGWTGSDMTSGAQPKPWALGMLLAWHRTDVVSTKETNRNNEVYKYQSNRNPFIDDPQFAEKIWGTLNAIEETGAGSLSLSLYPNPAGEFLNIEMQGYDCPGADILVFDTRGCLVRVEKLDDGVTQLDVQELASGIYFIRLSCGRETATTAFIVD